MRHLILILWLCIISNTAYTQSGNINKFSLSIQLGTGYLSPNRFFVSTTFDIEPAPLEMISSDFPRLEWAPLQKLALKLAYRLGEKWSSSVGFSFRHYQMRGRVGASSSGIETIIDQTPWLTFGVPISLHYQFPVKKSDYRIQLGLGIVPTYYFLGLGWSVAFTNRYALSYQFGRFQTLNMGYTFDIEWLFPLGRRDLAIGFQLYMAYHSPIKLIIAHYEADPPIDGFWIPYPGQRTYQYQQKIRPHQILFFISIPLTNSLKAK